VQPEVKIVLELVFEADFLPCSSGFRPKRSAHDALQIFFDESWQVRRQGSGVFPVLRVLPGMRATGWSRPVVGTGTPR
jgi:hypothetical protein